MPGSTTQHPLAISLCMSLLALSVGCSSSSNDTNGDNIHAQAIDGYIVGATVFCDDVANGGTSAAGRLTCPPGTGMMKIRGGTDVGFDENATGGGNPFTGELTAPAGLEYLTPLSTIAVAMSTESDGYNADRFDESVTQLAKSLGLSSVDLNSDASKTLQTIKLNAQIHQIISGFSSTADDYAMVTKEFAAMVRSNAEADTTINLAAGVSDTLVILNSRLTTASPSLSLSAGDLDALSEDTKVVNVDIELAREADVVAVAVTSGSKTRSALSIDRDTAPVQFGYGRTVEYSYTLKQYEQDQLFNGSYPTIVGTNFTQVFFGLNAFTVNETLSDKTIGIGFEFESTTPGDLRKLSVTTSDALLTMTKDSPQSMQITFPGNTRFHARSVDKQGTTSTVVLEVENGRIFNASYSRVGIDFDELGNELTERGHQDITRSAGNFKVTLIVSGVKVNFIDDDDEFRATSYSVDSGSEIITGSGFQGYLTVYPY